MKDDKQPLEQLNAYGKQLPIPGFHAVNVHPLADEVTRLQRLGMAPSDCTSCDVWWAYGKGLFLVCISGNKRSPGVDYCQDRRDGVSHAFHVDTSRRLIDTPTVAAVLSKLAEWLDENEGVLDETHTAPLTVTDTDPIARKSE